MHESGESGVELRIAEYLISHGEGIKSDLLSKATGLETQSLYSEEFEDEVVSEIINILTHSLNISYIEAAQVVDKGYLRSLLGKEFFKL